MATTYKRTIIQVPLQDVKLFEKYAKTYGLSVSSAIVMLAKKSIDYEEAIQSLPTMLNLIKEQQENDKKEIASKKKQREKSKAKV